MTVKVGTLALDETDKVSLSVTSAQLARLVQLVQAELVQGDDTIEETLFTLVSAFRKEADKPAAKRVSVKGERTDIEGYGRYQSAVKREELTRTLHGDGSWKARRAAILTYRARKAWAMGRVARTMHKTADPSGYARAFGWMA